MYWFLIIFFAITGAFSVAGMIKYGANIIFIFILLFSAVTVIWSLAATLEAGKKEKDV